MYALLVMAIMFLMSSIMVGTMITMVIVDLVRAIIKFMDNEPEPEGQ